MIATYAADAAAALERLRGNADLAALGLTGAVERFAQRVEMLQGVAASRPTVAPPAAAAGAPLAARTPSISTPSLAALSPATTTVPTAKGAGQGAGFPLPLPVRVVSMDARASAQMAVLALPGQAATVAQRQQGAGATPIKDRLDGAGSMAAGMFSQLKGTIESFASMGDPFVAFPTYKASVEGLSISISQMFSPALLEASGWIQRATTFLDGLDAGTKANIGR
jgi:hypothetical protein